MSALVDTDGRSNLDCSITSKTELLAHKTFIQVLVILHISDGISAC